MLRVVGMGGLAVSGDPQDQLVTYALGTCIGLCGHDPVAGVGGLLHAMLPEAALNPERAHSQPAMFVDSGLEALLQEMQRLGASPRRLVWKLAGAMDRTSEDQYFDIGRRNRLAVKRLLWRQGSTLSAEECGGRVIRTVRLEIGSGRVLLKG